MIVVIDEGVDPGFDVAGQIIVFQQDAILERLMPAFDLALCLRMPLNARMISNNRVYDFDKRRIVPSSFNNGF
jgi:hypothetical protein